MSTGKVLLGILAGVAAGATLGILLAPDKGSATRKKITQKGDAYVEELEDKFNEFLNGINKKFEGVRNETVRMAENGKMKATEVLTDLNTAAHGKLNG